MSKDSLRSTIAVATSTKSGRPLAEFTLISAVARGFAWQRLEIFGRRRSVLYRSAGLRLLGDASKTAVPRVAT